MPTGSRMKAGGIRVRVRELNPHLVCVLCGGYFISATTITECLHSFCKDCIVSYLETSNYCPICDVLVHKTKPTLCLRRDHILQDLVYKMVPGLLTKELKQRKTFQAREELLQEQASSDVTSTTPLVDDVKLRADRFYTEEEKISVALVFSTNGKPVASQRKPLGQRSEDSNSSIETCRYLLCPAPLTIGLIKRFLRSKMDLPDKLEVDVFHSSEALKDDYTLMDVAYIYTWRRTRPLKLYYSVYDPKPEPPKLSPPAPGTKRISYELSSAGGATYTASFLPLSPTSSTSSTSPEMRMRIRRFNTGFFIRDQQSEESVDANNNDSGKNVGFSSPVRRDLSFSGSSSRGRGRKRKRGRPRKIQPNCARPVNVTCRNFTFQTAKERAKAQRRISIPVSFPKEVLSDIDFERSDKNSETDSVPLRGSLVKSDQGSGSEKELERVPRTSTPMDHTPSESETGSVAQEVQVSSSKRAEEDSGYGASLMPKEFNVLRFNSDEETD